MNFFCRVCEAKYTTETAHTSPVSRPAMKWLPASNGFMKLNCDQEGPLVAESLALREALAFAIRYGYGRVKVESDSIQLVWSINGEQKVPLEIEITVEDIGEIWATLHTPEYSGEILGGKFQYTTRQSNSVAHCVAHWNHRGTRDTGCYLAFEST
ncbi:hypothetical protein LIER_29829 [Lithospermum erythrorhizon]|uniref:RNase H type-1 domain-containing protein n=1 Tax=Lithospermum erythrorhizon TaxID=34254 RepID=A0AAV3RP43_LITER